MTTFSNKDIAQAIHTSLKEKGHGRGEIRSITEFLARRRLISKAPSILQELQKITDAAEGIVRVRVASVAPLGSHKAHEVKHALMERYKVNEALLDEVEDKSLIGGIKIEVGDEILDLSVQNRMNKLKAYVTRSHE